VSRWKLFERYGIELEYMIVDRDTLDVAPISDSILVDDEGTPTGDVERGDISWSNELVLHVLEFKCTAPAPSLEALAAKFQAEVAEANQRLAAHNAMLLPSAMHPWMDPFREMRLWPHDYNAVYAAFDAIFDCRGHGWANLQSMHINLPFGDEDSPTSEFARLHAAIRLALPILPALAASSPLADGALSPNADQRLEVYRNNARRVPSVAGRVIPEPVFTHAEYQREILERIYRDLAPLDTSGELNDEWCNARGAIARFSRNAIEIRVIDVQECPLADLAIAGLVSSLVEAHTRERWIRLAEQSAWQVEPLAQIFLDCVKHGEDAVISDARYLSCFGVDATTLRAGELWKRLRSDLWPKGSTRDRSFGGAIDAILQHGSLSTRIRRAVGPNPQREDLKRVYRELATALAAGRLFTP